jgi:tetratricopeptide (TPR) repeat protein
LSVDLTDRIGELESQLAHEPSPGVFAPLAEAYRLSGRLGSALETARRGVDAHPDHLGIRIVLARAVADSGRRAEALQAYREVLARDEANLEAQAFLDAEPEVTETRTREEASSPPTDGVWSPDLERVAEPGHRAGAGSLSEELAHLADLFVPAGTDSDAPSLGPTSIATLTLAEIYSRQGLYGKAAEVCERILEREPDNERARSALEEYRSHPASV